MSSGYDIYIIFGLYLCYENFEINQRQEVNARIQLGFRYFSKILTSSLDSQLIILISYLISSWILFLPYVEVNYLYSSAITKLENQLIVLSCDDAWLTARDLLKGSSTGDTRSVVDQDRTPHFFAAYGRWLRRCRLSQSNQPPTAAFLTSFCSSSSALFGGRFPDPGSIPSEINRSYSLENQSFSHSSIYSSGHYKCRDAFGWWMFDSMPWTLLFPPFLNLTFMA